MPADVSWAYQRKSDEHPVILRPYLLPSHFLQQRMPSRKGENSVAYLLRPILFLHRGKWFKSWPDKVFEVRRRIPSFTNLSSLFPFFYPFSLYLYLPCLLVKNELREAGHAVA
jgi:hypothetical protein